MLGHLPKTWNSIPLDRLTVFVLGGDWGKNSDYDDPDYVCVRCIRASELRDWGSEHGSTAALRKIKKSSLASRELRSGDIIVEVSGGGPEQPVGRTALINPTVLAKNPEHPKICTNFFRLLRPAEEMNSDFLHFYLEFFYKTGKTSVYQGGSNNLRNLKFNDYLTICVPIPPAAEQHRIVAKIGELVSELDKGVESLNMVRAQLKAYRQAVLKHAFEGKLTAKWREENKDKLEKPERLFARFKQERAACYERQIQEWRDGVNEWEAKGKSGKKPSRPKKPLEIADVPHDVIAKLPQLSESWAWGKLGWLTLGVEYGTAAKSAKSGTVPVLRMGNIQNTKFDWADLVYTSDDNEISEYLLHDGDVLFNRTNSPELVGKTAIYRGERPAIFAGYLIRVNHIRTVVNSQYMNLFLNSHVARQYGSSVKTDGVNQSNINGTKLSNYPFPCCSIEEQREIARILEKTLSLVDKTAVDIRQELEKADSLRQAILKRAFSGHLVAQDPDNEPASVFLDRIKAERDKIVKNKIPKKKK